MRELKTTKYLLFIVVLVSSCYYDVEEDLYETTSCSSEDMSYTNDILPIIETDCYECHSAASNFGNVTLEGHDGILKYVNDGSLLGAIRHDVGYSAMPSGGAKLLDCEIEKIESWITDGALNN